VTVCSVWTYKIIYSVEHRYLGHPITWDTFPWHYQLSHQREMSQQQHQLLIEQEGRIDLALIAYRSKQIPSLRRVAIAFSVPLSTLTDRNRGNTFLSNRRNGRHKITPTEEQTIVRYILDLDSRRFSPLLGEIVNMKGRVAYPAA
jgi:hypothetical protein